MKKLTHWFLFWLLLFLPTQFGLHFWPAAALIFGRRTDYLSPTIYMFDLLFMAFTTVTLINFRPQTHISQKYKAGALLLLISLVTLWGHHWSISGVYFVLRFWQAAILIWLIKIIKPKLKHILPPLLFGAIFVSLLATGQFLKQASIGGAFYFLGERKITVSTPGVAQIVASGRLLLRPYATFSHPNVLGGYLTLVLAVLLFAPKTKLIKAKPLDYLFKNLALAAVILGIWLSFGRVAWLASFGLLLVRAWQYQKSTGQILLSIFLVAVVYEELLLGRFVTNLLLYPEALTERLELIKNAGTIFMQAPATGVGLGNFIPKLAELNLSYANLQPVHSIYLLWLTETGVIGTGLVFYYLMKLYRHGLSQKTKVLLGVLVSGLVLGLFDHYLITQPQTRHLWLIMLAALSV